MGGAPNRGHKQMSSQPERVSYAGFIKNEDG